MKLEDKAGDIGSGLQASPHTSRIKKAATLRGRIGYVFVILVLRGGEGCGALFGGSGMPESSQIVGSAQDGILLWELPNMFAVLCRPTSCDGGID